MKMSALAILLTLAISGANPADAASLDHRTRERMQRGVEGTSAK